MYSIDYDQIVSEIRFEIEKIIACRWVTWKVLNQFGVKAYCDIATEEMMIELTREIPTILLDSVEYPENWWEAFKDRWAPRWFLRRWPVKRKRFEARAYFEKLKLPDPRYRQFDFSHAVMIVQKDPTKENPGS